MWISCGLCWITPRRKKMVGCRKSEQHQVGSNPQSSPQDMASGAKQFSDHHVGLALKPLSLVSKETIARIAWQKRWSTVYTHQLSLNVSGRIPTICQNEKRRIWGFRKNLEGPVVGYPPNLKTLLLNQQWKLQLRKGPRRSQTKSQSRQRRLRHWPMARLTMVATR